MSAYLLLVVVVGLPQQNSPQRAPGADRQTARPAIADQAESRSAAEPAEPRRYFDINRDLRRLLRAEAVEEDRQVWRATVVDLVKLYGEITRDDRLATSAVLNGYRIKLRSRLLAIQKRLAAQLKRDGRYDSLSGPRGPSEGAGGGAAVDHGMALVELIQRTISPDFWDVNGGPGTIVYYRQWHALVIRATPEIHRQIGGAIGQARK
jgi:hypothetical protein